MSGPKLGGLAWLLAAQFFVAQVVVAAQWTTGFSLKNNVISDLGNTRCGPFPGDGSAIVCSPWHAVMNASFVIVGVTMAAGAILSRQRFARGWRREMAVLLFVAAGLGVLLVGVFPENDDSSWHVAGAAVNFLGGNVALILFGLSAAPPTFGQVFSRFSVLAGLAGLVATALFVLRVDLGLGLGGMERVAAHTTSGWQVIAGATLLVRSKILNSLPSALG